VKNIFKNAKILVCVGSGGVGKTTLAASLGVLAAQEGLNVLVLTIDPSKRLAQTLGIENTTEITEVPGQKFRGKLWASVVDHKKVFDDFVRRAALKSGAPDSEASADKILKNRLYQQLSTSLSGSQEFTALELLYSCYDSKKFDLIILDTPPAKHAMDFLKAPQKLSALFNEGIAQWFRHPPGKAAGFFVSLIQTGTRQVLKALENLTGADFIKELADFFLNIEKWQGQLEQRTIQVHQMLVHPQTQFCLVASFDAAKLKEAEFFAREIRKNGYHLTSVLLNRVFPDWMLPASETSSEPVHAEVYRLAQLLRTYYERRLELYRQFERKLSSDVQVMKLPDYVEPVSDLEGLNLIGKSLMNER